MFGEVFQDSFSKDGTKDAKLRWPICLKASSMAVSSNDTETWGRHRMRAAIFEAKKPTVAEKNLDVKNDIEMDMDRNVETDMEIEIDKDMKRDMIIDNKNF